MMYSHEIPCAVVSIYLFPNTLPSYCCYVAQATCGDKVDGTIIYSPHNLLLNPNLDDGWSKSYTKNITWNDIAPPPGITVDGSFGVIGATSNVVGFKDKPDEGSGAWLAYGDLAPMQDGVDYVLSIWIKVESDSDFKIQPYTCDSNETQRQYLDLKSVKPADGWANHSWAFTGRACDSMSFRYYRLKAGKVWLAAPKLERGTSMGGAGRI